jgi:4-hydroxy-tetrahydrodipicolinate synthase
MSYIAETGPDFTVLLGRDTLIYAGLLHGAKGSITATANVIPSLVVDIYESYANGDLEAALAAQERLAPLRLAFSLGTFPVVVKEALDLVGIAAGPARSPVGPLGPDQREALKAVIKNMQLEKA